jgi:hypothetical protein
MSFDVAISEVRFEHRDDLVISLVPINHAKATDWLGGQKKSAMRKRLLGKDANIHRVAVTLDNVPHFLSATE